MDEKSKSKPGNSAAIYKIIVGSFKLKENAEKRVAYLDSLGIDLYVHAVHISNLKQNHYQKSIHYWILGFN